MAKQNIYDNDSFFENFKNLRNNKINFNDCIETPDSTCDDSRSRWKKGTGHRLWHGTTRKSSILIWGLNLYWVLIFLRKCLSMQRNISMQKILLTDKWHWKIYVKLMSSSI